MQPVSPVIPSTDEKAEIVYTSDAPNVNPLPTLRTPNGTVLSRWLFSDEERRQIAEQGFVYLSVMVNTQPTMYAAGMLQPVLLTADVPAEFAEFTPKQEDWPEEFGAISDGTP